MSIEDIFKSAMARLKENKMNVEEGSMSAFFTQSDVEEDKKWTATGVITVSTKIGRNDVDYPALLMVQKDKEADKFENVRVLPLGNVGAHEDNKKISIGDTIRVTSYQKKGRPTTSGMATLIKYSIQ